MMVSRIVSRVIKGQHLDGLSLQTGITIRTGVALISLDIVSFPQWKMLGQAGSKSLTI